MRRKQDNLAHAPGQDSFLDIVANLVGILIILVMVIGVRAKDAMLEAAPVKKPPIAAQHATEELEQEVETARRAASSVQNDIFQVDAKIKQQELDLEYRKQERQRLQLLVATADELLAERRVELDESQQKRYDLQTQIIASQSELDQLRRDVASVQSSEAPVAVIDHLPTPMARTVFGKEIHFRLEGGKLAYVPWDDLVKELRDDVPQKLWRLRDQNEFTETLGPFDGFWLKYTLVRRNHAIQTRLGVAVQNGIELDHFVVLPDRSGMGEPEEEWFTTGSVLNRVCQANPPERTTVTIWTYPDSFNEFRRIKQLLFELGYLTASRPIPAGQPIGGAPRGTRSAAQ